MRGFTRLLATSAVVAVTLIVVAPAFAAVGDIGFRDQSYAPLGGSPSGTKPESKLWFNNGWWASMYNPAAGEHRIYKLNSATNVWSDTGVAIDARDSTRADTLWVAATGKLYVSSHVYTTSGAATTSGNEGRLYRFSYDAGTGRYSLDAGFPVSVNSAKTETLVIDRDSTRTLWATWTQSSRVYVNHTVGGNDAAWGTPYIVPGAGTSLTSDDISSLIHFGANKTGVMWSNQVDHKDYFSVHADGSGDTSSAWSTAAIPIGTSTSDDHINLKTDGAGRVYAAVKTSDSGSSPLILLLIRSAAGTGWSQAVFGLGSNSHTRPIVELDTEHGVLHMFATCPQPPNTSGQSGGDICEKTAPMCDSTSFSPGIGTAVIREAGSPDMNDATSTKQNLSSTTGLVVMANNATSKTYWHMQESLGGAASCAASSLAAGFTGTPTSGTAPLVVAFTDSSTGSPTSWSWDFGDGGTSTAQSPSHTYQAAGTYTVKLTVSDGTSSDTLTRINYIVAGSSGGGGGSTQQVFTPIADAQVKSSSATTNYGTLSSLRLRQGTSPTDSFYHSYLTFTVSGLSGSVTAAKLRLFVTDASDDGGSVFNVDPAGWTESGVTWNNAPALVTPIASVGATSAIGAWTEVGLGSLITGNGTYSVGLSSASSNSAIYDSREGTNKPQLVVTTDAGGAPAPLAAGFTGTPTSGTAPLVVAFTDSSTGSPTSWSWDFGDGGTSTAQSPSHTYQAAGTYTVKLTVSDGTSSDTLTRTNYIVAGSSGGGGGSTQQVFTPIADAQVKSSSATTNYGTLSSLRLRQGTSPTDSFYHSYLTFTVSGLSGSVTAAKLRLFVTDASDDGGSVFNVDPAGWTESGVTWNNAPALVTPIASVGATSAIGAWTEVGLGSLITGNGTYSVGLSSASSNSAIYDSREGTNKPQLVVTTG